jgi:hypothetical protein
VALREERMPEIITQVAPQWAFWAAIGSLHPERSRWTIELGLCALQFAMLVTQRLKHALACPRPIEYDPTLQPIILTPPYATFPGGHAVESVMVLKLLTSLAAQEANSDMVRQLERLTLRIAENRVVAGLHFPVDSAAGYVLGDLLAEYFLGRCGAWEGKPLGRVIKGSNFKPEADFVDLTALYGDESKPDPAFAYRTKDEITVEASPLLHELWTLAREEWELAGF